MSQPVIVCTGRELDADAQPVGDPCGAVGYNDAAGEMTPLRAAGWHIGPPDAAGVRPAMCPRCAKPDRDLVKLCASLAHGVSSRPAPMDAVEDTLPGL